MSSSVVIVASYVIKQHGFRGGRSVLQLVYEKSLTFHFISYCDNKLDHGVPVIFAVKYPTADITILSLAPFVITNIHEY